MLFRTNFTLLLALWLTALAANLTPSAYCQKFQAEGTVVYTLPNRQTGKSVDQTRNFVVVRDGERWRIRTSNPNGEADPNAYIEFWEISYNGVCTFSVEQHDPEKLKQLVDSKTFSSTNFVTAMATVKAGSTIYMDASLEQLIWLAYAAKPYLMSITNGKGVSPFFAYNEAVPKVAMPIKYGLAANPAFVDNIQWLSDGTFVAIGKDWSFKTNYYAAPYNTNGWVQARFEVSTWTNVEGQSIPASFNLAVYSLNKKAPLFYSMRGSLSAASIPTSSSFVPELKTRTLVRDYRFDQTKPVGYYSNSRFIVSDSELHNYDMAAGFKSQAGGFAVRRLLWVQLFLAMLVIAPIALAVLRIWRNKKASGVG